MPPAASNCFCRRWKVLSRSSAEVLFEPTETPDSAMRVTRAGWRSAKHCAMLEPKELATMAKRCAPIASAKAAKAST